MGEETAHPGGTICHFLDLHASLTPLDISVKDIHGHQLTFAVLQRNTIHVALRMQELGVRRGARVCLLLDRSIPQIVAIFSALRLGAAYVPFDGALVPATTILDVISEVQPAAVLVSRTHLSRFDTLAESKSWHCIEEILESEESGLPTTPFVSAQVQDPAYVIYTSGTTGKSKGVVVSHSSVVNLVCQGPGDLGIRQGTKVAQLLNVGFDMCAWEIFSCLLNGGTLYLRGPRRSDWVKVMRTVDVIICTPSILELLHDPEEYPNIKVVATAGEPCLRALMDRWVDRVRFYNCCGPTEVTIVNSIGLCRVGEEVAIGRPTPNNSIYVLDDEMHPVPVGEVGIILGYLNRPDLSAVRYRPDPFRGQDGMMYNTGDLGRMRADGRLEHLGRVDDQVKVKGFRVELDSVSATMSSCPGIISSCALLIGTDLHGFYAPSQIPESQVKDATSRLQPYYAVPTKFHALDSLPLTSNGKVDKQQLRELIRLDGI
ncbi:AMP-binding protein [Ganoderma leucocontextum]|nr:AMP-binding protein [Ganoderma leucocontextum]